ncbi:hypothetical protein IU500_21290 [Nocardia terpenica]|nr:hypothetical protein [Nocardia terpenica]MBF6106573.1 hypothetical protein [Nocardia terpenica]MBF6113858.1 hypothetical protein [Nocardia terpenica]MBF6120518.1 hypothetical protein [Nocardia terpenica]MBF6154825.1 hypothetical protein [Nocardia terpenica]
MSYMLQLERYRRLFAMAWAESILVVLEARDITVPDDVRERIETCTDPRTLDRWIRRAVTVATADELVA